MKHWITSIAAVACLVGSTVTLAQEIVPVEESARTAVGIAAYSGGFAVVRDVRNVTTPEGTSTLRLTGIPETVQRDSVVAIVTDGAVSGMQFPLERLNARVLLQRALGQEIDWVTVNPQTGEKTVSKAQLLSLSGGITLRLDGLVQTDPPGYPAFSTVPDDVPASNGLDLGVVADGPGARDLTVRYLTGGIGWRADFSGTLSADGTQLTFDGTASITNQTQVDYRSATVSLIAGDINRRSVAKARVPLQARAMALEVADAAAVPEQAPVQDYHRYNLRGLVDVPTGIEQRIPLFETRQVSVDRPYRLTGNGHVGRRGPGQSVVLRPEIFLTFKNTEEDGLGLPLPSGLVRVYDSGNPTPVLLGEDRITHVAKGQKVELALGRTFDVTARKRQTDFRRIGTRGEFEAAQEIILQNAKATPATVEVIENLFGEWRILRESQPHSRLDANRAVWTVVVPPNGETTLSYRYTVRP